MTATAKKFTKTQVRTIKPGTWVVVEMNGGSKDPKDSMGFPLRKRVLTLLLAPVGKNAADVSVTVWIPDTLGLKYVAWDRVVEIMTPVAVPMTKEADEANWSPVQAKAATPTAEVPTTTIKVPVAVKSVKAPTPDWPFGGKTLDNVPKTKMSKEATKEHLSTFGEGPASAMKAGKVVKTSKMKTAMDAAVKDLKTVLDKKVIKAIGKKPKAKIVKKAEKARVKLVKVIRKDLKTNELAKGKKVATKRIESAKFA